MRSFATILATITLPLYALAAHHGNYARDHGSVALRVRGDLLPKRSFDNARMTYYIINVGQVACGGNYNPNDHVVALNAPQFGDVPGSSQYCGQSITIHYNGVTVSAVIVDKCVACPYGGLDLTQGLFTELAGGTGAGVIYGTWDFGSGGGGGGGGGAAPSPKEQHTTTSTPQYIPPETTSTQHYDSPSPIPHTTSTPPPPPPPSSSYSSSTDTSLSASSSVSTTSTTTSESASQSYSSSPVASPSSVVPYPSGVATPTGTVQDGQTSAIADIYDIISGLGQIIMSRPN